MFGWLNGIWWIINLMVFHFLFWRKIRHDLEPVEGTKLAWSIVLGSWVVAKSGGIVLAFLKGGRGWELWSQSIVIWPLVAGVGIGILWWLHKHPKLKWQHEWEDGMMEAIVWYGLIESLRESVQLIADWQRWYNVAAFGLIIVGVYLAKSRYRKFKIYKSGKTGFIFWTGWIVICLTQMLRVIIWGENWYVRGGCLVLNLILLIIALLGWYKRAGRKLVEDWPGLYYWFK